MVALFVVATIIVFLVADYFVQRAAKRKAALSPVPTLAQKPRFIIPKGYFFGKGHTWVELLPDGSTRVGLDDFVQKILGPVGEIALVSSGEYVKRGDKLFLVRQEGKEMAFRAPVSGRVIAFNEELKHSPEAVRREPYRAGWIAMIEPTDIATEIKQLSIGNDAALWLRDEIKRFRNFITEQVRALAPVGSPSLAGVTLMDGGIPVNDVMEHSPQEIWRNFENDFLASDKKAKTDF